MGVAVYGTIFVLFSGLFVVAILKRKFASKCGNNNLLMNIGYYLYSTTKLGYWYFRREVNKSRKKLGGKPHSQTEEWKSNGVVIQPIPFSEDNYCYLIVDEQDAVSVLIDPADPDAIQAVLDSKHISPVAILSTHKHWDHSGGNEEWRRRYPRIKVIGGSEESIPGVTDPVSDGDRLSFGRLNITARLTPGHTSGHMVYVLDGMLFGAPLSVFTGDMLFVAGAGKMFEGVAMTMLKSLDVVADLSGDTLLWPGHEYALTNIRFASSLEPENVSVQRKLKEVEEKRLSRLSTVPSTVEAEMTYNPFMRTHEPSLLSALRLNGDDARSMLNGDELRAAALAECRKRKDAFKYRL